MTNYQGQFQPCPLCGNCSSFHRPKRDKGGDKVKHYDEDRCLKNLEPEFIESGNAEEGKNGHWKCEGFESRNRPGHGKYRKDKPWKRR